MNKKLSVLISMIFIAALLITMSASVFSAPHNGIIYYDENGNQITVGGMYYNSQGYPMFNAQSYYLDANGNPVYVGGCRAYYYNASGNFTPGSYFYDANGNAVTKPSSYPNGYGCGWWYYGENGSITNGTFYYDDFGNPVTPPANSGIYSRGGCCRW